MEIRALSAADYAAWLALWKGYQAFYKADIPEEVSKVSFARMLDPAEPTFGAVAVDGEKLVGIAHCIVHRSNWTIGDYCYLQDLYVSEESRRLGVGRLLIEHVYATAAEKKCPEVYWLTEETNLRAQSLYNRVAARSGFIHYLKILRRE